MQGEIGNRLRGASRPVVWHGCPARFLLIGMPVDFC
jgi:hypothetical protein